MLLLLLKFIFVDELSIKRVHFLIKTNMFCHNEFIKKNFEIICF